VEIVLALATGALTPVFEDLYEHAKTSVRAFTANLSSEINSGGSVPVSAANYIA
jgi:hypothetical protein